MAAPSIRLRRSSTNGAVPTTSQLALGEVAINTYDGKLFIKKDDGSESIVEVGASSSSGSGSLATAVYTGPSSSQTVNSTSYINLDIDTAGHAVIEAKRFFDFEGFHDATLTAEQMKFIVDKAKQTDYFSYDHVYDAPVTDIPSTLTILQTSSERQWVYNRLNAPEGLRTFESEMDAFIRSLDWKPFDPKKSK